jgi:Na+-translocating ferredoxin:NAD+ oxidoreductase RnfD subunit
LTTSPPLPLAAVRRFFRTPKGLLIVVLAILTALSAPAEGLATVAPGLASAIGAAAILDLVWLRLRDGDWVFPSGAILTGWIVAMVLSPHEPWHIAAVTAAIGVASKYVFRSRTANVFNPAALALVATFYAFDTGQSWWGALPEIPPAALVVLIAAGVFITNRVNKFPIVLVFLGVYYALFTVTAFAGDPVRLVEIYRAPDLHAVLYFAFFILTDPPTSPAKYRDQMICGAIVAAVSFGVFEAIGAAYYLLAGVLAGNVWEAWRRRRHARARARSHHGFQPPHHKGHAHMTRRVTLSFLRLGTVVFTLAAAAPAWSQTVTDERVWMVLAMQQRFRAASPWKWAVDSQVRTREGVDALDVAIVRPAVTYDLTSRSSVGGGYAYIATFPASGSVTSEQRVFEQYTWTGHRSGATVALRTRCDQRSIENNSGVSYRIREQVRVSHAVSAGSKVTLVVWDEIMVNANDTTRNGRGIDQNRVFGGVGVPLNPKVRFEAGYLNQYSPGHHGGPNKMNHVLSANVGVTF